MIEDKYKTYEYSTGDPISGEWCTVYELDKALKAIKLRHMHDMDSIERLKEENKRLKEEKYKDNELLLMKTKLEKMEQDYYRGFPISEEEQKSIIEWMNRHDEEAHGCHSTQDKLKRGGSIGGIYKYEFIPTSIGTIGTIKCSCGASFTFQDMI